MKLDELPMTPQTLAWYEHQRQAEEQLASNLDLAEKHYLKAMQEASNDIKRAFSQEGLALVRESQGKDDEFERLFSESHEVLEQFYGKDSEANLTRLSMLADYYFDRQRYSEAEFRYQQIAQAALKHDGTLKSIAAGVLNRLADVQLRLGKNAEAEATARRVLNLIHSLVDANSSPDHCLSGEQRQFVSEVLNNLTTALSRQRKYEEAEPFLRAAMNLKQAALTTSLPQDNYNKEP